MELDNIYRITILDSNKYAREMMVSTIDKEPAFSVTAGYSNSASLIEGLSEMKTDLILMDVEGLEGDGPEVIQLLKNDFPDAKILVVTFCEDEVMIYRSFLSGASGYIQKQFFEKILISSVKEIKEGGTAISPSIASRIINMMKVKAGAIRGIKPAIDYQLTAREKDVLALIAQGKNYKITGQQLNISYETVRSHMKNIYAKLQVSSLTAAVSKAFSDGLV